MCMVYVHVFSFLKLILLLGGMPFLWRKSGDIMQNLGFGEEYEVI